MIAFSLVTYLERGDNHPNGNSLVKGDVQDQRITMTFPRKGMIIHPYSDRPGFQVDRVRANAAAALQNTLSAQGKRAQGDSRIRETRARAVERDDEVDEEGRFTESFNLAECSFSSLGRHPYFILVPGYQLTLEGKEEGERVRLTIAVLDETKVIDGVETRVVEEREFRDGELVEISRNYFAICTQTNSVFYFGEDVELYEQGAIKSRRGSWRAGLNGAHAGLFMPGIVLLGARYFQEVAPGLAMDRAEIESVTEVLETPVGRFTHVLEIEESTPLEPGVEEIKFYAPGVGLVKDGPLEVVAIQRPSQAVRNRNPLQEEENRSEPNGQVVP